MDQGPAYYGDLDELDGQLLAFEAQGEEEGRSFSGLFSYSVPTHRRFLAEWGEAYANLRASLGLPEDEPIPKIPRPSRPPESLHPSVSQQQTPLVSPSAKRKHQQDVNGGDADVEMSAADQDSLGSGEQPRATANGATVPPQDPDAMSDAVLQHAQAAAAYITFLDAKDLLPPKIPTREEMEQVLLGIRKTMLMEEYFGDAVQA